MECDVVKDLLPLYIEKLTSPASNILIEEHLKTCKACMQTLNKLQEDIIIDNNKTDYVNTEALPLTLIKRIKKNSLEKIILAALIMLIIGILIGILSTKIFMFFAFIATISIISFTIAIFISMPICRRKSSLRKQFKALGYLVFLFSILLSLLSFVMFSRYFNNPGKIIIIIFLEILYNLILTLTLRLYAPLRLPKEDITNSEHPLNKRLFAVTLITLLSITVIIALPIGILEGNRIVDNLDRPFVNDARVIGSWKTVDLVSKPEQFDPNKQTWGSSLFLKNLVFLENGKLTVVFGEGNTNVPTPWMLWTKGYVLDSGGNHTTSKYIIEEISGIKYMFYEWKTSDYSYFHLKPHYYVLKKVTTN